MLGWLLRREVEHGVSVEESDWLQVHAYPGHWHDRPVLWPHNVMCAEVVPDTQVDIGQRPVFPGVGGKPIAARVLRHVLARGEALRRVIGRRPQMLGGERTTV